MFLTKKLSVTQIHYQILADFSKLFSETFFNKADLVSVSSVALGGYRFTGKFQNLESVFLQDLNECSVLFYLFKPFVKSSYLFINLFCFF